MIQFLIRDRDNDKYHPKTSNAVAGSFPSRMVKRTGREFSVGDSEIELFTIAILAEAMDRESEALIEYEKDGLFPKPMFTLAGHRIKRWYSANQVMNMHNLVWWKYQCRKNQTLDRTRFFNDIRLVFYEQHLVVDTAGAINLPKKNKRAGAK